MPNPDGTPTELEWLQGNYRGAYWRCECRDLNRDNDTFCYRCGAGRPEDHDSAAFPKGGEQ